ncbi:MAG: gfo/Idh/MocA family oxidoreductase [Candidatus Omnitrophica bacterium]|nr:gfo/Idh/MocA family oxidoreductase [Candidatus Omnitrophota bacterium]
MIPIIMKVGIIGVGKLGGIHRRIYEELPEITQIFLVDTRPDALSCHPHLTGFSDYRELPPVDAVSIATPTPTHHEIAGFFLAKGIPTFVEKPLTSTLDQANRLLELARQHRTLLFAGHVERYNNAYLAAKQIITAPLFIECHRLSPYPYRSLEVSVVLDLMIHDLDIILDLVKDDIHQISTKGVKVLSPAEDIVNARLEFTGGCVANVTSSRISAKRERKIRVFMPQRYVSLDYARQHVEIYQKKEHEIIRQDIPIQKEEPLKKEITEFIQLVRNGSSPLEYAESARDALGLALRIQDNIRTAD